MAGRDGEGVMDGREWAMLVGLSVLWGGSFFFNGVAVAALPSFTLVWLRVAVAAGALLLVLRVRRVAMPRDRGSWAAFAVMGLLNNAVPFSLIVWGQHQIASGLAAILNATTPLFTVLAAHLLTRDERVTPAKAAGVCLGFAGAAVTVGPGALLKPGADLWPELACLAAAVSYALAGIYGRRFRRAGVPPMVTAAGQVSASAVLLLPVALLVDRPWTLAAQGVAVWAAVAGLGLLSTALAYVLFFRILAAAGATNVLLVTFLVPVSAILLGAAVLGEPLVARHAAGMAGIAAGLALIDGRVLPRGWRPRGVRAG